MGHCISTLYAFLCAFRLVVALDISGQFVYLFRRQVGVLMDQYHWWTHPSTSSLVFLSQICFYINIVQCASASSPDATIHYRQKCNHNLNQTYLFKRQVGVLMDQYLWWTHLSSTFCRRHICQWLFCSISLWCCIEYCAFTDSPFCANPSQVFILCPVLLNWKPISPSAFC